jgi:hypothetical protein
MSTHPHPNLPLDGEGAKSKIQCTTRLVGNPPLEGAKICRQNGFKCDLNISINSYTPSLSILKNQIAKVYLAILKNTNRGIYFHRF